MRQRERKIWRQEDMNSDEATGMATEQYEWQER
jgi:hypothetical protein